MTSTTTITENKTLEAGHSSARATVLKAEGNSANYKVYSILLVEDDSLVRELVSTLLRKCGYRVTVARNGREALDCLRGHDASNIDVILTDNLMPEVTGIELVYKVVQEKRWQHVPVIVMSSDSSQETVLKAFEAGAADFLVKPVRRNELTTLWRHAWRASQSHRRERRKTALKQPNIAEESNASAQTPGCTATHAPLLQSASSKPVLSGKQPAKCKQPGIMKQLTEAASPAQTASFSEKPNASCQADHFNSCKTEGWGQQDAHAAEKETAGSAAVLSAWQDTMRSAAQLMELLSRFATRPAVAAEGPPLQILPLDLKSRAPPDALKMPGPMLAAQCKDTVAQSACSALAEAVPIPCAHTHVEPQSPILGTKSSEAQMARPRPQFSTGDDACTANRRAAIAKFRAKRSQRNFDKRVRYASRQRLAESRPRIRGQFVKADMLIESAPSGASSQEAVGT